MLIQNSRSCVNMVWVSLMGISIRKIRAQLKEPGLKFAAGHQFQLDRVGLQPQITQMKTPIEAYWVSRAVYHQTLI